ncbi:hypothetical protein [Enterococcus asini]|uniref:hypothetical protein n=1 Tax=Enterococcus asini TaxID=57732 RepID=UPI0022E51CF2|nr:hypothetical protein [Enterococcus asini]
MKKYVLGLVLILSLAGCGSNVSKDTQKANVSETAISDTSSIVEMISTSSTVESTIESSAIENYPRITVDDPTNQKFIDAFQNAGLGMYIETGYGVNDYTNDEKIYIVLQDASIVSGFNFLPEEFLGEFNDVMTIQNYASSEEMTAAADRLNNQVDDSGIIADAYKNPNTNSIFIYQKKFNQYIVKKYIEVFQEVK